MRSELALILLLAAGCTHTRPLDRTAFELTSTSTAVAFEDVRRVETRSTSRGLLDGTVLGGVAGLGAGAVVALAVWLRGQRSSCEEGSTVCVELRIGPRLPIVLGVGTTILGVLAGAVIGVVEGSRIVYERP